MATGPVPAASRQQKSQTGREQEPILMKFQLIYCTA